MLATASIHLMPILPRDVIVVLTAGLVVLLLHGSWVLRRKQVPGRWVALLAGLRVLILAVLVLCLYQPVLSFTRTTERKPDLLVLVDTSRSMSSPAVGGSGSRLDAARTLLSGRFLDHLKKQYQLRFFAFDRTANPVEERELNRLKAEGTATRLGESLAAALEYHQQLAGEGAPAPSRVVVVSDGADNGAIDPIEVARRQAVAVDVMPVPTDTTNAAPLAVSVADVQAPRRVLFGSECELQVALRRDSPAAGKVDLNVFAGDTLVATRPVAFASGQIEASVRLNHRPAKPGLENYAFVVNNSGVVPEHPPADAVRVSVQVVDTRSEVLVLEDSWRWEFKFLRRVLEDDPNFNFTGFLPRGPGFMQFAEPNRRAQLLTFPQGTADLEAFDLIVLGNVDPRRWPKGLAEAVAHAVMEEGKSLIVLAGPNLPLLAQSPALAPLLPVEITDESARPLDGPVEVRPSLEGAASPFLANLLTFAGSQRALPPLDRIYPPLRKRPGATILLEATRLANSYGNVIVMAEHTVGRGRVLFSGTDTIWKWQMLTDPNPQGATPGTLFWQQTLRAMLPAKPPAGGAMVWLQPERTQYDAGRLVTVRAEVRTDSPGGAAQLQAVVHLPDGRELPLVFTAEAAKAGNYRAEFVTSLPGEYVVKAALVAEGKRQAESAVGVSCRALPAEKPDTPGDAAALERLATVTGGRVIAPGDSKTWPADKAAGTFTVQQTRTVDLWNGFTLPILLCLMFGLDWTIRLLRGLV